MKTRPILFSGEMVRALLDGRKTQTRRLVKDQASLDFCDSDTDCPPAVQWLERAHSGPGWYCWSSEYKEEGCVRLGVGYGQIGDRLWVRETWCCDDGAAPGTIYYRADMPSLEVWAGSWRSSIHMARAASRITLEVVSVRVERLHEISEADAEAEAPPRVTYKHSLYPGTGAYKATFESSWRESFKALWGDIHGYAAWDQNPRVWVVEFKKIPQETA